LGQEYSTLVIFRVTGVCKKPCKKNTSTNVLQNTILFELLEMNFHIPQYILCTSTQSTHSV